MSVKFENLEAEIGSDRLLEVLESKGFEAKAEYEDTDPDLQAIRDCAATTPSATTPTQPEKNKRTVEKPVRRSNNSHSESAIAQSASNRQSSLVRTGVQVGANEAKAFKQARQSGFLHQMAIDDAADAEVLGDQLLGFSANINNSATVDVADILGEIPTANGRNSSPNFSVESDAPGIGFFA